MRLAAKCSCHRCALAGLARPERSLSPPRSHRPSLVFRAFAVHLTTCQWPMCSIPGADHNDLWDEHVRATAVVLAGICSSLCFLTVPAVPRYAFYGNRFETPLAAQCSVQRGFVIGCHRTGCLLRLIAPLFAGDLLEQSCSGVVWALPQQVGRCSPRLLFSICCTHRVCGSAANRWLLVHSHWQFKSIAMHAWGRLICV